MVRISLDSAGEQTGWSSNQPVWSRDGSKIAFVPEDDDYGQTLMVKSLATGALTQMLDPANAGGSDYVTEDLVFSPDGSRLGSTSDYPQIVPGDDNNGFVAGL